ncbi:MAG: 2-(1 2-epoxy-1 2-dihydrophenyl)acetyl-CoA isomerase [Xanthobacteraceae bacterium]|nr:MAG: 2-(1 2-epoxy-1 2-dihydrophenyl)acetyl-CoA isomerase [Xanthobacteraceae bacterium]
MSDASTEQDPVLTERKGGVAIIRLNRPRQLNVLDPALGRGLVAAVGDAAQDPSVRAVVLAGNGRSFCAGGDLSAFHQDLASAPATATGLIDHFHTALRGIASMPKPVIAAVQGPVAGGGFSLAVACDMVVAAEDATFLAAYTKLGTSPDGGLTWSLTRLVGARRAFDLILTNQRIDAATALSWGLVNRIVPAAEVEAAALGLAAMFEQASVGATAAVKRLVGEAAGQSYDAQLDAEKASFVDRAGTADFREGISAFVERRPAVFPD